MGSQDVLEQSRWLYGVHAARSNSAQQRATAIMAFAGGVMALGPTALTDEPSTAQWAAFLATMATAVLTVCCAMGSLVPRKTEAPSVNDLRKLFRAHLSTRPTEAPVHQVVETLLRTTEDEKPSLLQLARGEADTRMRRLRWAYWALTGALVAVSSLTTLNALQN